MVTIKDIAKLAGVSKSTVSRVLCNDERCKKETREKVLKAMRELNYTPNLLARAMVTKKTGIIGVVIYSKHMPAISHPFYSAVLDSIAAETKKFGYSILIMADHEVTPSRGDQLIQHRVDGLILISRITEELIHNYKQSGIPFVLINNTAVVQDSVYIVNDDYVGAYDAGIFLIEKGYRNIAYISGPLEHRSYRLRWEGFQAALACKGYEIKPYRRFIGDSIAETGMEGTRYFLQQEDKPDAIFASNDMIAIGALQVLYHNKIRVPQDMAVMGFDDIDFAKFTTPPLSTVKVDKKQMGKAAVNKLISMINGEQTDVGKIILPTQIIEREST
jgi:LacI family transcriptional regulator/LacI family purine nucleotide synthesis repressor